MPPLDPLDPRLQLLVDSAWTQPPEERDSFLLRECAGDDELFDQASLLLTQKDPFAAGTILANRFRLVRHIGAGGMGMVYEAIDQTLDRRVALKCAKPRFRQSLSPEARAAREVSHFNVCKVHDVHTAGDFAFLSMEFIEGQTLSS